jgi:hypothetical protein
LAAVLAASAAVRLADGQEPAAPVSVDVSECVKLTTPEERLACFERQVEGSRTSPAASGAPAASSAPAPANGSTGASRQEERGEQRPDIHAVIVALRETVPQAYLITLDNGQVWRQTVPKSYPLREGDRVRIYFSRWRAYRLTNEELKGFIQVDRAR